MVRELENMSAAVHAQPRPHKVELEEINFVSDTLSLTAMDSHLDYCDAEYSIQCLDDADSTQWMADHYESTGTHWRRCTLDVTPSNASMPSMSLRRGL